MAHEPSEHEPDRVAPDASPDGFEYSEVTTPGSPDRLRLEAAVAELGWSNLFELLPPGVAQAYEAIYDDLSQLTYELSNPPKDPDERLRSLGTYVRTVHRLDQYRDEFGMWWGFPPDTRRELNRLTRELRTSGPFTANQIERLLERWSEVQDESVAEFIELARDDVLAILTTDGRVGAIEDGCAQSLAKWTQLGASGGNDELAEGAAGLARHLRKWVSPV